MKTKLYYIVLVAGIVLIGYSFRNKQKNLDSAGTVNTDEQKQEVVTETKDTSAKNYLEGVLYKSEESKLGNYKLSSDVGDIYLHTSRNFSGLIGFKVMVQINGTKDKFELVDIQSKVTDGGFVKEN